MVLNLWVVIPLGWNGPFTRVSYQIFMFVTVVKLQLRRSNKNSFMIGVPTTQVTRLKVPSVRKSEDPFCPVFVITDVSFPGSGGVKKTL